MQRNTRAPTQILRHRGRGCGGVCECRPKKEGYGGKGRQREGAFVIFFAPNKTLSQCVKGRGSDRRGWEGRREEERSQSLLHPLLPIPSLSPLPPLVHANTSLFLFPHTSISPVDFEEEMDLWVPRKASHTGLMFLVSKIPHAPPQLITGTCKPLVTPPPTL